MNEQLTKEIEALEEEAATYRRQGNYTKYNEIMTEANQKRQQLTEAAYEERVTKSQEQIAYIFDNVVVAGQQLRDFFVDEETYQLVRIEVQQAVNAQNEQLSQEFKAVELSYQDQLKTEREKSESEMKSVMALMEALQKRYDDLYESVVPLNRQIAQLQEENADLESKRDAAARELDSANTLLVEKQEHIDTLRTEIATGARNAVKTITQEDIQRDKEAKERAWRESRIKVTNLRRVDGDYTGRKFEAELATTGETIQFSFLEKGKYLEVTPEEAEQEVARFRAEQAQQDSSTETVDVPTVPVGGDITPPQVPPFQTDDTTTLDSVPGESVAAEVEASAGSYTERLEALERRVAALEQSKVGAVA